MPGRNLLWCRRIIVHCLPSWDLRGRKQGLVLQYLQRRNLRPRRRIQRLQTVPDRKLLPNLLHDEHNSLPTGLVLSVNWNDGSYYLSCRKLLP